MTYRLRSPHLAFRLLPLFAVPACVADGDGSPATFEPPDCQLEFQHFRVASIDLPGSASEAQGLGVDLNGDGQPDNVLGALLGQVPRYAGPALDYERAANAAVGRDVHWIVEIGDCPTETYRQLALHPAEETAEGLRITSPAPERPAVMVRATGEPIFVGGVGTLPLSIFLDPTNTLPETWESVYSVTAQADRSGDALTLRVAMAVPGPILEMAINGIMTVAEDEGVIALLDSDEDGILTVEELRHHYLVGGTFGNPDLDLFSGSGRNRQPGGDGVEESFSLGMLLTAVAVAVD